jgi:peptidoglycan/LPS O-acetylase OafA/YrhL
VESRKNREIECLRGIAILAVWLSHFRSLSIVGRYLPAFTAGGGGGVQLFFVISGFVVGRSLLRALAPAVDAAPRPPATRILLAFYLRRAFRIWPMGIVGILLALLLARGYQLFGAFGASHFTHDIWLIATLRLNYALIHDLAHPLVIYWSLVAEEHFYLVLPLVLLLTPSPSLRRVLFVAVLAVTLLVARPALAFSDADIGERARTILYATHLALDFFAAGVLIALMSEGRRLPVVRRSLWLSAACLGCIAIIVGVGRDNASLFTYGMPLLLGASGFLVLIAAPGLGLFHLPGPLATLLEAIGARSYAIYLVHFPVLLTVQSIAGLAPQPPEWLHALTILVSAVALTLIVVEVCHRFVEKPLIAIGGRFSTRLLRRTRVEHAIVEHGR